MDYYAGEKRGVWPTKAGNEVLIRFDAAMRTISHLLDYAEWPSDEVHETVIDSVPMHLRVLLSESWSPLLDARIAGAPGYIGTHHLFTDRMAGDAWNVHWAHDAAKAAAPVIRAFEEDLAILEPLVEKAKRSVISG